MYLITHIGEDGVTALSLVNTFSGPDAIDNLLTRWTLYKPLGFPYDSNFDGVA